MNAQSTHRKRHIAYYSNTNSNPSQLIHLSITPIKVIGKPQILTTLFHLTSITCSIPHVPHLSKRQNPLGVSSIFSLNKKPLSTPFLQTHNTPITNTILSPFFLLRFISSLSLSQVCTVYRTTMRFKISSHLPTLIIK